MSWQKNVLWHWNPATRFLNITNTGGWLMVAGIVLVGGAVVYAVSWWVDKKEKEEMKNIDELRNRLRGAAPDTIKIAEILDEAVGDHLLQGSYDSKELAAVVKTVWDVLPEDERLIFQQTSTAAAKFVEGI